MLAQTDPVGVDSLRQGEVQRGDELVDVRAAHGRTVKVISQHVADQRLPRPWGTVEGQHQGAVRAFILKELGHFLWHDVLDQVLSIKILVEVPLQV